MPLSPIACSSGGPRGQGEVQAKKNQAAQEAAGKGAASNARVGHHTQTLAVDMRELGTSRKVVALTFDAGSDVGYTNLILDTLKASGVKATFGMSGEWAEANPELLKRMVDEGHIIINHTYSHRSFTGLSTDTAPLNRKERARELHRAGSTIREIAGVGTRPYFRPPYGDYDASVLRDVSTLGYGCNIMWSTGGLGAAGLTKDQILRKVVDELKPGAIYLFHVGSQSQDGPALPDIISELRQRGYVFATVDEYCPRR